MAPHTKEDAQDETAAPPSEVGSTTKQPTAATDTITTINDDEETQVPDPKLTEGVQKVEAITQVWTKVSLIALFASYVC